MKILRLIFSRTALMVLLALLELFFLIGLFRYFSAVAGWVEGVLRLLSLVIVLHIARTSRHLSADLMWILIIMAFPIPGTAAYLSLGADLIAGKSFRRLLGSHLKARKYYAQDPEVLKEAAEQFPGLQGQLRYLSQSAGFPVYRNTGALYYPLGDVGYPAMLEALRKARRFIFLEYFIIEEGRLWSGILDILKDKAARGVEVRVMYDDLGSLNTLPAGYAKKLERLGIQCVCFNQLNPIINIIVNHRDHRKILVIDGETAFTGGINLADEYINAKAVHGHWKDNCIKITGKAVWSLTCLFLTNWNACRPSDADFRRYQADALPEGPVDGYIAPYGEIPLDSEITGQDIYLNLLSEAADYCYIYTPYLIIDTELANALILAARRGVDVRIMTPGIPDKKIVWDITRSFYKQLIKGGVKIFEYTPGFVHAKVFVSDDRAATVGTLNLDYRSLYLHFEDGVYLCGSKAVLDIRDDYRETLRKCHQLTLRESTFGLFKTAAIAVIRIFAPLM